MPKKVPIAIILPHGGLTIPPELIGRISLTAAQIFNEADAYSNDLYAFEDQVLHWVAFPYARAILDVNRPLDPALNRPGDGAIKRQTSYGTPVFQPGQEPDSALEKMLVERYWQPWHAHLDAIANDPQVKLVFDCHTMAAIGPGKYDDPDALRPRGSVSNYGDRNGKGDAITAPFHLTQATACLLGDALADAPTKTAVAEPARINHPFFGGWNLSQHGGIRQPWLMLEINRALYVGKQSGESPVVELEQETIADLRERIWQVITAVSNTVGEFDFASKLDR